ncbi:MAG: hypothetical protein GY851_06765, partial [bacterium]|nr:hypothetical protein [bacterium]
MMHKVTYKRVLLSVACLSFALWPLPMASATGAGDSRFSEDGFLKIDGVPRLIIGLYELPQDDAKLAEIAENGFNLVRVPQDTN